MIAVRVRRGNIRDEFSVKVGANEPFVLVGGGAEPLDSFFERESRKLTKPVVERDFAADKVIIHAFFETRQHVVGRDFAERERFEHELESRSATFVRDALVPAPPAYTVEVAGNKRDTVEFVADFARFKRRGNRENPAEFGSGALDALVCIGVISEIEVRRIYPHKPRGLEEHGGIEVGVNALARPRKRGKVGGVFLCFFVRIAAENAQRRYAFFLLFDGGRDAENVVKIIVRILFLKFAAYGSGIFFRDFRAVFLLYGGGDDFARIERVRRELAPLYGEVFFKSLFLLAERDKRIRGGQKRQAFAPEVERARNRRRRSDEFCYFVKTFSFFGGKRRGAHVERLRERAGVETKRFEFAFVNFKHAFARDPPLFRIIELADSLKRRTFEIAALFGADDEFGKKGEVFCKTLAGEFFVKQTVDRKTVGRVAVVEVPQNRLVHRKSDRMNIVHGAHFAAQPLDHFGKFAASFVGEFARVRTRKRHRPDEFFGDFGFLRFFGIKFETEIAYSDVFKSARNDVERGCFFRDEQYALTGGEVVCDYVGYSLGLARSGRSVKNETLVERIDYRRVLRRVRAYRQDYFAALRVRLVRRNESAYVVFRGEFAHTRQKRADKFVFAEFVHVVVNVLPHQIPRKGHRRKVHAVVEGPAFTPGDFLLYTCDRGGESGGRGGREVRESAKIYIELSVKVFEKGRVYVDFVLVYRNAVRRLSRTFARERRGIKKERSIARFFVVAVPLHEPRGKVKRRRSRFFQSALFFTVNRRHRAVEILARKRD